MTGKQPPKSCYVLWSVIKESVPDDSSLILSFLKPIDEHELVQQLNVSDLISMVRVMDTVKKDAYDIYLEVVADIGRFSLAGGKTLRSRLHGRGRVSQWWYHPVAFRNSESEPTYTNLLAVLAILKVTKEQGIKVLHLHHPPDGVAETLRSHFSVIVDGGGKRQCWLMLLRRLLGRIRYCLRVAKEKRICDKVKRESDVESFEVALQGFWNWSIFADFDRPEKLKDRYFRALPEELKASGKRVGYWCWYDPWTGAQGERCVHRKIIEPLKERQDILLLQSLLGYGDILRVFFDFSAFLVFLSVVRKASFRSLFESNGVNFFPMFRSSLLDGALGMAIVQCQLFEKATVRANAITGSRLLVTFLEHFPQSRAMYAALRKSGTQAWSIQHACYNWGKTYGALHATKEFGVQPDGESVPHPDRICVMGELGSKIFSHCGYDKSQVLATGSCRYDHVKVSDSFTFSQEMNKRDSTAKFKILVASSLPAHSDFVLLETVVAAVKPVDDCVTLRLRSHPFGRMDALPGFSTVADSLELSAAPLPEDLDWADLVIISQSVVGEEAILAGKEVWQIRFPHPDQSSLAEVASIPRFYSVGELQESLKQRLLNTLKREIPFPDQVYRSLFQVHDELPSKAIAKEILLVFDCEQEKRARARQHL